MAKIKLDLKCKDFVYFEPVRSCAIYQALNYLKLRNKFYEGISISEGLSNNEMLRFPDIELAEENPVTASEIISQIKPVRPL